MGISGGSSGCKQFILWIIPAHVHIFLFYFFTYFIYQPQFPLPLLLPLPYLTSLFLPLPSPRETLAILQDWNFILVYARLLTCIQPYLYPFPFLSPLLEWCINKLPQFKEILLIQSYIPPTLIKHPQIYMLRGRPWFLLTSSFRYNFFCPYLHVPGWVM